jgi:hypothetical protein
LVSSWRDTYRGGGTSDTARVEVAASKLCMELSPFA